MTPLQRYVLNSLFVRDQITEERLIKAIDNVLNNENVEHFLSVLITDEKIEKDTKSEFPSIIADISKSNRIELLKLLKQCFNKVGLKEIKDIVDSNINENIFKCNLLYFNWDSLDEESKSRIIEIGKSKNINIYFSPN